LGTPASRKITVSNLFANVVPATTHKGVTTFVANTSFTGTTMTVSANLVYQGTEVGQLIDAKISVANAAVDTAALWSGIIATNTSIRTLVSDRMQVANTNTLVNDRMQVANTVLLVNDRMQVANVLALASDYLQVANAESSYVKYTDFAIQATAPIVNATTNANTPVINVTTASGLQCTKGSAPSSNNTATESVPVGTIFFSNNYLYIATDATTIKRVPLEVFS
jgi:hypothetical protein